MTANTASKKPQKPMFYLLLRKSSLLYWQILLQFQISSFLFSFVIFPNKICKWFVRWVQLVLSVSGYLTDGVTNTLDRISALLCGLDLKVKPRLWNLSGFLFYSPGSFLVLVMEVVTPAGIHDAEVLPPSVQGLNLKVFTYSKMHFETRKV